VTAGRAACVQAAAQHLRRQFGRIGRPVMSKGRTPGSAVAASMSCAPIRAMSPSPYTPTVKWPPIRKARPPNIFFSLTPAAC
jgi:hypothetical protein